MTVASDFFNRRLGATLARVVAERDAADATKAEERLRKRKARNAGRAKARWEQELRATMPWTDARAVHALRVEAHARGLQLDHIVPLNGKKVSGLDVQHNMQLITWQRNASKGNRFDPWTHVHELPTPQPA